MAVNPPDDPINAAITLTVSARDLDLLVDGLHAAEYWDYATELDLPRRNGQVFLPEDDPSVWRHVPDADGENAIEQIRLMRELRKRLEQAVA